MESINPFVRDVSLKIIYLDQTCFYYKIYSINIYEVHLQVELPIKNSEFQPTHGELKENSTPPRCEGAAELN